MMNAPVVTRGSEAVPELGYGDYLRFSQLLLDRCGLHFAEGRRSELELGIRHAFATSTCADLDDYYGMLQDSRDGSVEIDRLINAVTVGETHFFRDTAQFDALCSQVLPQIIERRRPLRTLRIWSAGCASGEEPYSIAMLLRELLPDVDEWAITILGTDINTEALDRARKATYGEWAFRETRAKQWRPRYFHPLGNRHELNPEVRRMVTFAKLNLAEGRYPAYETNTTLIDLILCRNVTIYFSECVTLQVVERFYDALVDGGWLVVGHSEPSLTTYRRFQVRNFPDAILYQRTGQPTALPLDWNWMTEKTPDSRPIDFQGQPQISDLGARTLNPASLQELQFPKERDSTIGDVQPVVKLQPLQKLDSTLSALQSPNEDPLEQAQELLEYGHSEQARDVLLKLVKSRPGHALNCTLLGQAYANLGCWQEAEEWCGQAVRLDKLAIKAYYTLALVHQHQGKLDEAIDAMKKVVYIDRNYVLGHFGLANLYYDNNQLSQAQKSLDNARRLLDARPPDELIPGSGGITTARLREAATHQQQMWSMVQAD